MLLDPLDGADAKAKRTAIHQFFKGAEHLPKLVTDTVTEGGASRIRIMTFNDLKASAR